MIALQRIDKVVGDKRDFRPETTQKPGRRVAYHVVICRVHDIDDRRDRGSSAGPHVKQRVNGITTNLPIFVFQYLDQRRHSRLGLLSHPY